MMMAEEKEVETVVVDPWDDDDLELDDEDTIVSLDTIATASSSSSLRSSSSSTTVATVTSNNSDTYYYYCPSNINDDVYGDMEVDKDKISENNPTIVTHQPSTSSCSNGSWTIVDYNTNLESSYEDDDGFDIILFPDTTPTVTLATAPAEVDGNFERDKDTFTTTTPQVVVGRSHGDEEAFNNENNQCDNDDDEQPDEPDHHIIPQRSKHHRKNERHVEMDNTSNDGEEIATDALKTRSKSYAKQVVVSSSRKVSCGCCFHFYKYGLWLDGRKHDMHNKCNISSASIPFGNDSQLSSSSASSSSHSRCSCNGSRAICGGILC